MSRTQIASDDFSGTAAGNHPANFSDLCNGNGQIQIATGGGVFHAQYSSNESDSRWNGAGTFSADQYAKVTVRGFTSGTEGSKLGVFVRGTADVNPNRDMYRCYVLNDGTDALKVDRVNNDAVTNLFNNTSQTWADGDTVSVEVTGTGATVTLRAFRNDVQVGSDISDSNASRLTAAGKPGIYAYQGSQDTLTGDDFSAGDVTANVNMKRIPPQMTGGFSDLTGGMS